MWSCDAHSLYLYRSSHPFKSSVSIRSTSLKLTLYHSSIYSYPNGKSFSSCYYKDASKEQKTFDSNLYIQRSKLNPPHYQVIYKSKLYDPPAVSLLASFGTVISISPCTGSAQLLSCTGSLSTYCQNWIRLYVGVRSCLDLLKTLIFYCLQTCEPRLART